MEQHLPITKERFLERWNKKSRLINQALSKHIQQTVSSPFLQQALFYVLGIDTSEQKSFLSAKRLRPMLALIVCQELGGCEKQALPFALANELFHSFLLIHDDIENQDTQRRGQPAAWVKFGLAQGINLGDYLHSKAYEAIFLCQKQGVAPENVLKLLELLTQTALRTGEGQAVDMQNSHYQDFSLEDYLQLIIHKTGYYMSTPLVGGAIIAQAEKEIIEILQEVGKKMGAVFQVMDDILDFSEHKGRQKFSDIRCGSKSYPILHAAHACAKEEQDKFYQILGQPREDKSEEDILWCENLITKYQSIQAAHSYARELYQQTLPLLAKLPSCLAQQLRRILDQLIVRR